jgi:hypothetical protein
VSDQSSIPIPAPKSSTQWDSGHGPKCKLCGQDRTIKVEKGATEAKPQAVRVRPLRTNVRIKRRKDKRYVQFY